ncbi:hypothetical protein [Salibacterium lacus]|uniref:Uncharacterized protein n=1 Tax=Salibacterium lacus TaxID=1898109 RepID=A0ABW5T523_9BACI
MNILRQGFMMWIPFALLCLGAGFAVELAEGSKIGTSAYPGRGFIVILWFAAILGYPFTFLPLTLIVNRTMNRVIPRMLMYTAAGALGGYWYFTGAYAPFIDAYDLRSMTAVLSFGAAGILYALLDHYLFNHPKAFQHKPDVKEEERHSGT